MEKEPKKVPKRKDRDEEGNAIYDEALASKKKAPKRKPNVTKIKTGAW